MDNKSNNTFSNKFNNSIDCLFSEQNSRLINNNTNFNFKNPTTNFMNLSYFNNNQSMTNFNNPINMNNNNNINNNLNNNSILSENYIQPEKKAFPENIGNIGNLANTNNIGNNLGNNLCNNIGNIDDKYQYINRFKEEIVKIENIIIKDPSINPKLKPQDCLELYGYPFMTQNDNYGFSQLNNAFKQKYLMKTLFDNKYIYINGKQYKRIMKRREDRKKLNESVQINKNKLDKNKKYHHESRHRHAMNRERGKGGRFVSKKKVEMDNKTKNDNKEEDKENEENDDENNCAINDKTKNKK